MTDLFKSFSQSLSGLTLRLAFIGATVDGSSETGLGELENEAAVKTYLDSYTSDWKITRADGTEEDFNQTNAAAGIWAKKID